jgi:hypothetical protein
MFAVRVVVILKSTTYTNPRFTLLLTPGSPCFALLLIPGSCADLFDDLYRFNLTSSRWTQLDGLVSGHVPSPRRFAGFVAARFSLAGGADRDRIYLFGGSETYTPLAAPVVGGKTADLEACRSF